MGTTDQGMAQAPLPPVPSSRPNLVLAAPTVHRKTRKRSNPTLGVPLLSASRISHHSKESVSPLKLNIQNPLAPLDPLDPNIEAKRKPSKDSVVVDLDNSVDGGPSALADNFQRSMTLTEEPPLVLDKDLEEFTETDWKRIFGTGKIQTLEVLGEGNGGSVKKCAVKGKRPAQIFALKTITSDPSPEFQKQIVRELNYNKKFKSPYIVKYYGTFLNGADASIFIAMEYMGGRSLDAVYQCFKRRGGRIGEKPLGKVAEGVLRGLSYLNQQKIMHRDIKPQNILLDDSGNVKLCDFGVSGEVVNSLATTFTGTSFYMAPERIRNEPYTISCDVWSLGLTLLEGAMGMFPFAQQSSNLEISPIDLLLIILEFEPNLEDEPDEGIVWSASFKDFMKVCLTKENRKRPSPRQMLEHPWIQGQMKKKFKMEKLVKYCWSDQE